MEWMIICIFVVGISCFFLGFCIRRRRGNNNRRNVRDEVLINDSNNRQNVRENSDDNEVILVNTYSNKDLSISHSSYQINSFVESSKQNLAISQTNLIINNNIVFNRIDDKHDSDKIMSFFRTPGELRQRLEKREKIDKQQISRRYRKVKSKTNDMSAPKPMDEDVKEDNEI